MIRHCKDLAEAIAIAQAMKAGGSADWFRGQVRNWPLQSAFVRRGPAEREAALDRIATFKAWIEREPALADIAADDDAVIAVAQHYGLPTNFIDFSTEPRVAAFFAVHDAPEPAGPGELGCIVCLNSADFARFSQAMSNVRPELGQGEPIRVDIPELWRLQAQHGTFLHYPFDAGFERTIYDMDRLVFPAVPADAVPPGIVAEIDIYPPQKSDLEILLDQFFTLEGRGPAPAAPSRSGFTVLQFEAQAGGIDAECFGPLGLPPDPSWSADRLSGWRKPAPERWVALSTAPLVRLSVARGATPAQAHADLSRQMDTWLAQPAGLRRTPVRWQIELPSGTEPAAAMHSAALVWDGLRRWPYADADVARGIATAVVASMLMAENPGLAMRPEQAREAFGRFLGEAIEVEIGMADGSYTRGWVGASALRSAVRDDFTNWLAPAWRGRIESIQAIQQVASVAQHVFDFGRLASVFARQVAPTQAVLRGSARRARLYNPARSTAFGLP